jgi:hypothetical protein
VCVCTTHLSDIVLRCPGALPCHPEGYVRDHRAVFHSLQAGQL